MTAQPQNKPILSLVFLLPSPRELATADVAAASERAFGGSFRGGGDGAVLSNPNRPGQFLVRSPLATLLVLSISGTYVKDVGAAADSIRDFASKKAMQDHKAWMSVDWMGEYTQASELQCYQYIGKLAAELVNEDALAVVNIASNKINSFWPELLPKLRSNNPLAILEMKPELPIINMEDGNARLAAAIEEAKRRWPEFVDAFAKRRPLQGFAVKMPFVTDDGGAEYMWVEVREIRDSIIHGKLMNEPRGVSKLKFEDPVIVNTADLNDWMYSDGKRNVGGFTTQVLMDERDSN